MFSPDIRREPNVFIVVNIMQTNDPETIGNLARPIHRTYNVSNTLLH